jgi:hypothetical protein
LGEGAGGLVVILKKHLMIGDTDLNVALQNFLYEYVPHPGFQSAAPSYPPAQRLEFERTFSREIDRLYPTSFILKQKVAVVKSKLSGAGRAHFSSIRFETYLGRSSRRDHQSLRG